MNNEIISHRSKFSQWGSLCLLLLLSVSSQASFMGTSKDNLFLKSEHWLRGVKSANWVLKSKTPVLFVECSPVQTPVSNTFLIRERFGKLNHLALTKLGGLERTMGPLYLTCSQRLLMLPSSKLFIDDLIEIILG